jgi:HTH-type transcriptional regulator / antitoxin HipB
MNEQYLAPIDIGQRVKNERQLARLSQDELADLAEISRRPIYLLETGKGTIRLDTLMKILDVLGLTLEIRPKGAPK